MEAFQAGGGVCPSGGNTGILAFADHLHAQKLGLHEENVTFWSRFETQEANTHYLCEH